VRIHDLGPALTPAEAAALHDQPEGVAVGMGNYMIAGVACASIGCLRVPSILKENRSWSFRPMIDPLSGTRT